MAGAGPAPEAQTRRRNKEKFEELPATGYTGTFPALPRSYRTEQIIQTETAAGDTVKELKVVNVTFLKPTRDWYEEWARSPMATEFTGVHWRRLQLAAKIVDQYERTADPKLAAEIRLQEAGFGGTPLDLRRLGRKITPAVTAPAAAKPKKKAQSRRARLSLVS